MTTISLSDAAATKISSLMNTDSSAKAFRIAVEAGGCSGFQYKFDLTKEYEPDDIKIEKNGAVLVIDPISSELIQGAVIDYIDTLAESRFDIKNPNSSTNCGCGNSFNV